MNCIAIIPARGGSKGLPRKNVLPLCGKPLLAWTIESALNAKCISAVYVTTDDPEIATIAVKNGAGVISRPAAIAGDTASSESALLHALSQMNVGAQMTDGRRICESYPADCLPSEPKSKNHARETPLPDILVFLQCTSPLTIGADIEAVVEKLISENADSALSVTDFHYFLWKDGQNGADAVNHDRCYRPRRQDREPQYVENGAIYAMKIAGFVEARHRFFGKTVFHVMPGERCWEIDDPVDFDIAEMLLRKRLQISRQRLLPISVEAVVFDFDGVLTDDRVIQHQDSGESVVCLRADGMAIRHLREAGIAVLILSSEENPVVQARARKLKVEVIQGSLEKGTLLKKWADDCNIDLQNTIYVGNDVNDIPPMQMVGCPVAVANAYPEATRHALLVLHSKGGEGAARELADLILSRPSSSPS